jgi:perosamine synthetase
MSNYQIPVYKPDLGGNEKKYVAECIDSSWISSRGRFINEFERLFSETIGIKSAAAVSNGTVALHLALLALGIKSGDEIIVPTLTYIASVNSIVYCNAEPVFVDSDPTTWQMDPNEIEKKITEKTRAILVVHLYGHPCDMSAIMQIARRYNLSVVEDCAEAIGTRYKGQHVGTFGDIATFSFFGNKTITTGEGGMVLSNNTELIQRVIHFKGQGLAENREYWHDVVGYNYRMTNIQAAIGLAQLERIADFIERKRYLAFRYKELLSGLPVKIHMEAAECVHSYWMTTILVENANDRDPLRRFLGNNGIETRPVFYPVHSMPMYLKIGCHFHNAEQIASKGINLPSWPGLSEGELTKIASVIEIYYRKQIQCLGVL